MTLVGQRVFGIALGYEDLNDHDELRRDPMMAVLAGKLEARREDYAPVAGKSTLNRLELSRLQPTRYHKISHNPVAIRRLFVDLFLEAHEQAPSEIILDLDATDDPVHGEQEGRFFHGYYDCYCYLPLYVFCGRHLLAAKLRSAGVDATAGVVEELVRIVAQVASAGPTCAFWFANSGFGRDELMAWCEANRVDYLFGMQGVGWSPRSRTNLRALRRRAGRAASRRAITGTSLGERAPLGAARGGSSPKPSSPAARPIRASSSPRSSVPSSRPNTSTRNSTARAARWRTGSRSASSISMPIAPRRPRCEPTSCGCGSPRWPTCWSAPCADRAATDALQRGNLRHHPSQAAQDRGACPHQCSTHQDRHGLRLSCSPSLGTAAVRLNAAARARGSPA